MNLQSYKNRLQTRGRTVRDRIIYDSKRDINREAPRGVYYKSVTVDGVEMQMSIISTQLTTTKTIESMPGDNFETGSILIWNGSHWLVTERDLDDDITVRGKIELCQKEIVWQNIKTGQIVKQWATVEKPYFSNLSENKLMSVSTREFKIQMPYDNETSQLDVGKRLMLEFVNDEPKTYRITSVDAMTQRYDRNGELVGFLVLNVEQDQYNPNADNRELMICDYVDFNNIGSTTETKNMVIKYNGDATVRAGGSGKLFSCYSNNALSACKWTASVTDGVELEMTDDGKKCRLKVARNKHIGEKIVLTASVYGKNKSVEVEVISL